MTDDELEERLTEICRQKLDNLAEAGMVQVSKDGNGEIRPLQLGYLMARFCVEMDTMRLFRNLTASSTEVDVLHLLASSTEFEAGIVLRHNEKKTLAAMNALETKVRYPIDGSRKAKCKTPVNKAFLLLQLRAGGLALENFEDVKTFLVEKSSRILRALIEYAESQRLAAVVLAAVRLHKSILSGAGWHDSKTAQFQQFVGVGAHFATRLSDASGGSLASFAELTSIRAEQIMSKGPAILAEARALLRSALRLDAHIEVQQMLGSVSATSSLRVVVHIRSGLSVLCPTPTRTTTDSRWRVLVANTDGQLLLSRKITSCEVAKANGELMFSVSMPPKSAQHRLTAHLINEVKFGLDVTQSVVLPKQMIEAATVPAFAGAECGHEHNYGVVGEQGAIEGESLDDGVRGDTVGTSKDATPSENVRPLQESFDILKALDVSDSDQDEDLRGSGRLDNPDGDLFGEKSFHNGIEEHIAGQELPPSGASVRSHKKPPTPKPDPRTSAFFDRFRAPKPSAMIKAKTAHHTIKPANTEAIGCDVSSQAVTVRDGSLAAAMRAAKESRQLASGDSKHHLGRAGDKHVEHLQAKARSMPSTPVRRLPIPPVTDSMCMQLSHTPATLIGARDAGSHYSKGELSTLALPYGLDPARHAIEPRCVQERQAQLGHPQALWTREPAGRLSFNAHQPQLSAANHEGDMLRPTVIDLEPQWVPSDTQHLEREIGQHLSEWPLYSQEDERPIPRSSRPFLDRAGSTAKWPALAQNEAPSTLSAQVERGQFDSYMASSRQSGAVGTSHWDGVSMSSPPIRESGARPSISFAKGKQLSRGVLDFLGEVRPPDEDVKKPRQSPPQSSVSSKQADRSMTNLHYQVPTRQLDSDTPSLVPGRRAFDACAKLAARFASVEGNVRADKDDGVALAPFRARMLQDKNTSTDILPLKKQGTGPAVRFAFLGQR